MTEIYIKDIIDNKIINFTSNSDFATKNNYNIIKNLDDIEKDWQGCYWLKGYAPEKPQEEKDKEEIWQLKDELAATDYKIIKCSEYNLAGSALPYDIAELHAKRQALRDRINELEG